MFIFCLFETIIYGRLTIREIYIKFKFVSWQRLAILATERQKIHFQMNLMFGQKLSIDNWHNSLITLCKLWLSWKITIKSLKKTSLCRIGQLSLFHFWTRKIVKSRIDKIVNHKWYTYLSQVNDHKAFHEFIFSWESIVIYFAWLSNGMVGQSQ